jgi:hypothetical protein
MDWLEELLWIAATDAGQLLEDVCRAVKRMNTSTKYIIGGVAAGAAVGLGAVYVWNKNKSHAQSEEERRDTRGPSLAR